MNRTVGFYLLVFFSLALMACSSEPNSEKYSAQRSANLYVEGLASCADTQDKRLNIDSTLPLTILVHGCNASAGSFNKLSEVLALQGQQSVCFTYDDRDSLISSAEKLNASIQAMAEKLVIPHITLLGHSQGGLISRKASTLPLKKTVTLDLVTVSAPLSGIKAAQYCADPLIRVATLGVHDLVCWLISGDKWYEITHASDFIKKPGQLDASVQRYLLIATDERNSCREFNSQRQCVEDDYVFSLDEQKLSNASNGIAMKEVKLKAGHVEIVGNEGIVPYKLIQALQDNGVIKPVAISGQEAYQNALKNIYQVASIAKQGL